MPRSPRSRERALSSTARSPAARLTTSNRLSRLLDVKGPLKFFDVNLPPAFNADPALVLKLAKFADILKLNDSEVGGLAHWIQTGEEAPDKPRARTAIARDCDPRRRDGRPPDLRHARRGRRRPLG